MNSEAHLVTGVEGAVATETRLLGRIASLYPILRSITGPGLRETLVRIQAELPAMTIHEVASGTRVFDWTVPLEWIVREAYIEGPDGRRVADVARHNLMLVNYSAPFRGELGLPELSKHLHSLPERPRAIPYLTSYYQQTWGFCMPHEELTGLPEGTYRVVVDTDLVPGSLSYGELVLPGTSESEVLFSAHVCHPSLANDNLSAASVLVELAQRLSRKRRRYTYRILFAPGTIGALTFLARTPEARRLTRHGLVLAGLGDSGPLHYKRTRDGAAIDRVVERALATRPGSVVLDFEPMGYDERQYGSPGIRMPVGRLGRTPYGRYPEYHTSDDNLDFVSGAALVDSLEFLEEVVDALEQEQRYLSLAPLGEPQLGRRGLYDSQDTAEQRAAILWLLNLADGRHSLPDVVQRSGLSLEAVLAARDRLLGAGLLRLVEDS